MPFLIIDEFGEQGITLPRIEQPRAVQRAGLAFLIIDELGEQSVAFLRFQRCRFALGDTFEKPGVARRVMDTELGLCDPLLSSGEPRPTCHRGGHIDVTPLGMMRWGLQIVEPLKERSDKSCYFAVALRPRGPIVHRQYVAHRYSGDGSVGVQVGIVFRC